MTLPQLLVLVSEGYAADRCQSFTLLQPAVTFASCVSKRPGIA
ncbi:hypothetical protein Y023_5120 [Burkholderia pseudomallei A79D]|nr:hypothetical protein Y023_5120 [Burkholderia pseudomallei A79D]KGX97328.1 hypothetical protein X997_4803 [Burkholderia pseudomallei A79C]